jgi:hypothetical protein
MLEMIWNHLWQSTLFAGAVATLALAFRNNRAHVRYWLWLAASVKFLIPFSALLWIGAQIELVPHRAFGAGDHRRARQRGGAVHPAATRAGGSARTSYASAAAHSAVDDRRTQLHDPLARRRDRRAADVGRAMETRRYVGASGNRDH